MCGCPVSWHFLPASRRIFCHGEVMKRQMHLNLFIQSRGHHEASWRHPGASKLPLTDIDYTVEMAQKAEAGRFDSLFLADVLGLWIYHMTPAGARKFNFRPHRALLPGTGASPDAVLRYTCDSSHSYCYSLAC